MSSSATLSAAEAKKHIESIAEGYGWLSQEEWDLQTPKGRKAIENLRRETGSSARTVATNLYQSPARFVFELIQNAEDNRYEEATANGVAPYIYFNIYRDKIVIDCNEDGFSSENVKAICRIGHSSKKRTELQYNVGEKGIGFKSVFMVAKKVLIQSGPFSFSFEHEPGQSGMGMITPVYSEPVESPGPLTRMTLTLMDNLNHDDLLRNFRDLPDTFLLFLTKLRVIRVQEYNDEAVRTKSTTHTCQVNEDTGIARLFKNNDPDTTKVLEKKSRTYRITRKSLRDLPRDERRDNFNTAEVVLAFPIDESSEPLIERQKVYAYLPIRDFGFPASRQDVMECPRNRAILDGIAETFLQAVLRFCDHETLQYQWMKYLPDEHRVSDPFWKLLLEDIKSLLKSARILRPRSKGELRHIASLKIVPSDFLHKGKEPLVADLRDKELYLASEYDRAALDTLQALGLQPMTPDDCLDRFDQDLALSDSKVRDCTDLQWQESSTTFFLKTLKTANTWVIGRIRRMRLIPLKNGEWTSIFDGAVYFPDTDGVPIPESLGLRLVDPEKILSTEHKALLFELGVTNCHVDTVKKSIMKLYSEKSKVSKVVDAISHTRYLYLTHPYGADEEAMTYEWFRRIGSKPVLVSMSQDVYFDSSDQYGIQQILAIDSAPEPKPAAWILHRCYMLDIPTRGLHLPTWESWLSDCLRVLGQPRLAMRDNKDQLSDVLRHASKHSPTLFLQILKAHWDDYVQLLTPQIVKEISEVNVPTTFTKKTLKTSFLPLKSLMDLSTPFLSEQFFPYLSFKDEDVNEWRFLETFGVGTTDDLDFYLELLKMCSATQLKDLSLKLYESIQSRLRDSSNYESALAKIRSLFNETKLIFLPRADTSEALWVYPSECVWKAPIYTTCSYPLCARLSDKNNSILTAFFQETLRIPRVSFIKELQYRKRCGILDAATFKDIYGQLHSRKATSSVSQIESLKKKFETDCLIYVPLQPAELAWHPPSTCLWSDSAQIAGKASIKPHYHELEKFFTSVLEIKEPDVGILVEGLKAMTGTSSVDEIVKIIWQINSLLPTGNILESLREASILPVRIPDGTIHLKRPIDDFGIIDRNNLQEAFKGRISLLGFTLEESRRLDGFFRCLRLDNRYLSRVVLERSNIRGGSEEPSPALTRNMRMRAHALTRCAVHSNSSRIQNNARALYDKLKAVKVFETDDITARLEYNQGEESATVEMARSKLHIQEDANGLKIFVPLNEKNRELCYLRSLPEKLFDALMDEDSSADAIGLSKINVIAVIASLLQSSDLLIDDILDDAGIISVPFPDDFESSQERHQAARAQGSPHQYDISAVDMRTPDRPRLASASLHHEQDNDRNNASPSQRTTTSRESRSEDFTPFSSPEPSIRVGVRAQSTGQLAPIFNAVPSPQLSRNFEGSPLRTEDIPPRSEYQRLLERVVRAARAKRGGFPSKGAFDLESMLNALPAGLLEEDNGLDMPFGVRTENQLAHDMRIGAAGELYAFEILSNLKPALLGFSRGNWKSKIRKLVTVHEDYGGMEPWPGAETADITYDDTYGEFTKLLIENGYLDRNTWIDARPKYYLEVKTTKKKPETRFFLSKSQYKRMRRMKLVDGQAAKEVYIILRVFNLDNDDIDMRIYVDPEGMRAAGTLDFTAESWLVVPGKNV